MVAHSNDEAPEGVTPRTDALLRLGQAALEYGQTAGGSVSLTVHGLPREAYDALPVEEVCDPRGQHRWKVIAFDGFAVRAYFFPADPPLIDGANTDWFEVAKRITARPVPSEPEELRAAKRRLDVAGCIAETKVEGRS